MNQSNQEQITFSEIFLEVWQRKIFVLLVTGFFIIAGVLLAITRPNIYLSEALLSPNSSSQGSMMGGLASQFAGLSSLAGISLGSSGVDDVTINLERLKSKEFIGQFIESEGLAEVLFATNGWVAQDDNLTYDEDIYDIKTKQWVREVSFPKMEKPSSQELYKHFMEENLEISRNLESGLITVGIKHYSPYVAQDILNKLLKAINRDAKLNALNEAEKSIQYLEDELSRTKLSQSVKILYDLIESQQNKKMLASVKDEYAFKTIDPPIAPEKKYSPNRPLILVLFTLLGGFFAFLIVLIQFFRRY